jgi:hypothetical protein
LIKESHSMTLIVAYYLSKFDKSAYEELGFGTITATHKEVGNILGVNPNSFKNITKTMENHSEGS